MKLRIANKIYKAIGTPDQERYTPQQLNECFRRIEKTKEHKDVERYWAALMDEIGPFGRFDWWMSGQLRAMEERLINPGTEPQ